MLRFLHWAPEKAEYQVAFRSSAAGDFLCPGGRVAAPAAGPAAGVSVEVEVCFEPTAVGAEIQDVLTLSSPVGGAPPSPRRSDPAASG